MARHRIPGSLAAVAGILGADDDVMPRWVARIDEWWEGLLGPSLSRAWDAVMKQAGNSAALTATYGGAVAEFQTQLDALTDEAAAWAAELGPSSPWRPYADRAAAVAARVRERWVDPASTAAAASVSGPVSAVLRIGNLAVTSVGVAWAVASLGEVAAARRHLKKWRERAAAGRAP